MLTKYLEHSGLDLSDKRVLEVGAGTGLVGIAASVLGAGCVLITDLEYTLNNTAANIAANEPSLRGRVHTAELDWFRPGSAGASVAALAQRPHYILGADVVWVDSLIEPLVKTLAWATQPVPPVAAVPQAAAGVESAGVGAAASRVGTEFDAAAAVVSSAAPADAAIGSIGSRSLYSSHGPPPSVAGSCGGAALEGKLPPPPLWRDGRRVEAPAADSDPATAAAPSPSTGGAEAVSTAAAAATEPQTVILLAHQTRARSSDALLFRLLGEHGFEWSPLPHGDMHPRFRDQDINIFRIVRRPGA